MDPVPAADWANFFVAQVGASAALSGLVVVAISINLTRILEVPTLPARAAEALLILVGALVLTSIGLMPGQPARVFGVEMLVIGLAVFVVVSLIRWRSPTDPRVPMWRRNIRPVMCALATLPVAVGGALMLFALPGGLYWVAAGVVLSLITGVFNAWVLLVEIMR